MPLPLRADECSRPSVEEQLYRYNSLQVTAIQSNKGMKHFMKLLLLSVISYEPANVIELNIACTLSLSMPLHHRVLFLSDFVKFVVFRLNIPAVRLLRQMYCSL